MRTMKNYQLHLRRRRRRRRNPDALPKLPKRPRLRRKIDAPWSGRRPKYTADYAIAVTINCECGEPGYKGALCDYALARRVDLPLAKEVSGKHPWGPGDIDRWVFLCISAGMFLTHWIYGP